MANRNVLIILCLLIKRTQSKLKPTKFKRKFDTIQNKTKVDCMKLGQGYRTNFPKHCH